MVSTNWGKRGLEIKDLKNHIRKCFSPLWNQGWTISQQICDCRSGCRQHHYLVLFDCEMHHPSSLVSSSPWKWIKGWGGCCVHCHIMACELCVLAPATTFLLTCCCVWHCSPTFCNCVFGHQSSKRGGGVGQWGRVLLLTNRGSVHHIEDDISPPGASGIFCEPAFRSTFISNLRLLQKTPWACHVC